MASPIDDEGSDWAEPKTKALVQVVSQSFGALVGGEKDACRKRLLQIGYDEGAAAAIARHQRCTMARIDWAWLKGKKREAAGKLRKADAVLGYIRALIEKGKNAPVPRERNRNEQIAALELLDRISRKTRGAT